MIRAASIFAIAVVTLAGCSRSVDDGPPHIKFGQDECAHCGMILSDERCAAAMIVKSGDEHTALLFDDIGDMIDYEREHAGITVVRRYVHDFETRQWLDTSAATFLRSAQLSTPMGSGIIAFADSNRAKARQTEFAAELHPEFASLMK